MLAQFPLSIRISLSRQPAHQWFDSTEGHAVWYDLHLAAGVHLSVNWPEKPDYAPLTILIWPH